MKPAGEKEVAYDLYYAVLTYRILLERTFEEIEKIGG